MKLKKKTILKIINSVFLFLIIFNPPITPYISFSMLFLLISICYLLFNIKIVKELWNEYAIKKYLILLFIFFIYYFLESFINFIYFNSNVLIIKEFFWFLIQNVSQIFICSMISVYFYKNNYKVEDIIECFILAGVFQACLGIMAFIFPKIKIFFLSLMVTKVDILKRDSFYIISENRNYGLSSTLYDSFAYTMSILSIYALNNGLSKGKIRYYIYFIMIIFSGLINSRTTLILTLFGAIVLFIYNKNIKNKLLKTLFFLFLVILILKILFLLKVERFISGFIEIKAFILENKKIGYFEVLFNNFIFFPDNFIQFVFGSGETPQELLKRNTDVGYIQSIWKYGVLGAFYIYYTIIKLILNIIKIENDFKDILLANILMFLLYQIKLSSLGYSQAGIILITLCFYICLYKKKLKIINKERGSNKYYRIIAKD